MQGEYLSWKFQDIFRDLWVYFVSKYLQRLPTQKIKLYLHKEQITQLM